MSHEPATLEPGFKGVTADWSADKQAFPVPWGKAMMWIFLLSDTFIFSCFLTSYMNVRMSTTATWPNPAEVFALTVGGHHIPLLLIAIMTDGADHEQRHDGDGGELRLSARSQAHRRN